ELPSVRIANDGDVDPSKALLSRNHVVRSEDQAGAGGEHRLLSGEAIERIPEIEALDQTQLGGALAAGQSETVDALEIARAPNVDHGVPERLERDAVRFKASLQCENADRAHGSPASHRQSLALRQLRHFE